MYTTDQFPTFYVNLDQYKAVTKSHPHFISLLPNDKIMPDDTRNQLLIKLSEFFGKDDCNLVGSVINFGMNFRFSDEKDFIMFKLKFG